MIEAPSPADGTVALSIVTTLYRSEDSVDEFCRRAGAAAAKLGEPYELILVNDGSPDRSLERALAASRADPHIRVIDLSRNFGHHKAIMTGLAHARGARVFLLDSDLEESPEWLDDFRRQMDAQNADVVYGVQMARKGGLFERLGGAIFYATFNAMLEFPLPRNVVTARLMSRRYVAQLIRHRDREVCLAALWVITGFTQLGVPVTKLERASRSSYGFADRVAVMVNAITSFSNKPLVYIFYVGCAVLSTAAVAGAYLVWRVLFRGVAVAGWPSLIVSVWFLGGITIFCLGVIGMYLAKVFIETKDRPYTVVRAYHPDTMERIHHD
jgi:putative glycosyltransferase